MRRRTFKPFVIAALLATLLAGAPGAGAWTRSNYRERGNPDRDLVVQGGRLAFQIERDAAHGVEDGSDVRAIQRAFAEINSVATSTAEIADAGRFDFPQDVGARDGLKRDEMNRIYFFRQSDASSPVIATTSVFYEMSTGKIVEADIAFNEADIVFSTDTYDNPDADLGDLTADIQETATHELMHALGFGHSPVAGVFDSETGLQVAGYSTADFENHATMFPYSSGTIRGRTLNPDDVAALSAVYPTGAPTATITGRVIDGASGRPITGAHVVAVQSEAPDVPFVGTISGTGQGLGPGDFRIAGLPRGQYYVRIEPLRGTTNPFVEQHTPYTGFQIDFAPEFYSGAHESAFDSTIAMDDAEMVSLASAEHSTASIVIVTNAAAPTPVVTSATFRNGRLTIIGSGFAVACTAIEVEGHALARLRFPKRFVAPNRIATRVTSTDPTLGPMLSAGVVMRLVVVNTVTSERSAPVRIED
jgi:hypothetical protein